MRVGVNYPWRDYGWDFGVAPPSWREPDAAPRWRAHLDEHLDYFRTLGITVVRWFILADGLTYGSGDDAPRPDPAGEGWRFDPPPIDGVFLRHFEELLERFAQANSNAAPAIQLLPVLIDFYFCRSGTMPLGTPGWVKQGRADALNDSDKRRRFFDNAFEPLLDVSKRRQDVIFAWELINEPEWVTNGWHPNGRRNLAVGEQAMAAFLDEGTRRIRQAGLKATVGFASIDTLRRSGAAADVNQFHHYPGGRRTLEAHAGDAASPGIIGEFATAATDRWPEFGRKDQGLLNRLRLAEAQGYSLAIPWSFRATDRHTRWSPDIERDLEIFAQDKGGGARRA
jgi:hypothetical protein